MPCPHFGNYPAEYNRAIHGSYDPAVFYGKADTPLAEVKLGQLGSWFGRRNYHPVAITQAVSRAYWRYSHRFIQPKYSGPKHYLQLICGISLFFYLINYKTIRHHTLAKYH